MGVQNDKKTALAVSKTEFIVSPKRAPETNGETLGENISPPVYPIPTGETAGGNTLENSESMKKLSIAIRIQKDKKRKDGLSPLYLKVTHYRITKKSYLQMYWQADKFDSSSETCKPRFPRDHEANDRNLELGQI